MSGAPEMDELLSARSWLQAMLDVEAALASAEARAGLILDRDATAIRAACRADRFDVVEIGRRAVESGNPVIPMVEALRAAVGREAAASVHRGATSQDILDSATMLIARGAIGLILSDLDGLLSACATLAETHRATLMAGRTLLQQAVPITFGLKAAGWLTAGCAARVRLAEVRNGRLAIQFGGAAGTLAALSEHGIEVSRNLASELGLAEPPMPWHTDRTRIAEVGAALGEVSGVMGKIALDVTLLAQSEVGEVAEPAADGRGRSSAMPQKRNPVASVAVSANVRRVPGLVATLFAGMAQEHERAAGGWQAEWETLSELFRLTGGATWRMRQVLEGLEVDTSRMAANVEAGDTMMAEAVATGLHGRLGDVDAGQHVRSIIVAAVAKGEPFRDALLADPAITGALSTSELDALLDPSRYLGSSNAFIDRALAAYSAGLQMR
jgi:3-carboxy-cis,cis-muconate cycloisomerase